MLLRCLSFACLSLLTAQEPESRSFLLKSQEVLAGRVLRLDGATVVMHVDFLGGSATVRRSLADFAPASVFEIQLAAAPPKAFAEHLQMAAQAVQLGLLPQAGRQAELARSWAKQDASGEQQKTLDAWVAATLSNLFDKAIENGELADARHWFRLAVTRVPDSLASDEVQRMLDGLAGLAAKGRRNAVALPAGPTAEELAAEKLFAPVLKHVQQGDVAVAAGLRDSRHTVKATHSYELALARYKTAGTELQHLLAAHADDAFVQAEAAQLVQRVKDGAMQAALHAGHALVVQGDYRTAYEWANKALLLEPGNSEARALRNTVEMAQAAGSAWGLWGRIAQ